MLEEGLRTEDVMAGKKLENKILPPDPARIIEGLLSVLPEIEHVTPLPPLLERVHKKVKDTVEELPRLKQMGEFPKTGIMEFP